MLGAGGAVAAVAVACEADKLAHRRRLAAMADGFAHALGLPGGRHGARHSGALPRRLLAGADNLFAFRPWAPRDRLSALIGLAIARAFLKDAPNLAPDEATSAPDPGAGAGVLAALRAGRTTFVIAHRLSTVRDADLTLAPERGRIVERGRCARLAAAGGFAAA